MGIADEAGHTRPLALHPSYELGFDTLLRPAFTGGEQ